MKKLKKLASVALALVMAMALMAPAFAAGETGRITIDNASTTATYKAYKIFDMTKSGDNYSYTIKDDSPFKSIVSAYQIGGKNVFVVTPIAGQTGVSQVKVSDDVTFNNDAAKVFVESLRDNATVKALTVDNKYVFGFNPAVTIGEGEDAKTTASTNDNLPYGYYYVDSNVGSLCVLNSLTPDVEISDKNIKPVMPKDEDNADGTKKIGDTVNFGLNLKAQAGAENYVVYDRMGKGLTFDKNVKVYLGTGNDKTELPAANYTVTYATTENPINYTKDGKTYSADFKVEFTQTYLKTITAPTDIRIEYSAKINKDATTESIGNSATMKYGENEWTTDSNTHDGPDTPDPTKPQLYNVNIAKVDGDHNPLAGAKFELYADQAGNTKIDLVKESDGVYRVADATEKTAPDFVSAVIEVSEVEGNVGKATVKGLGNTTYYLKETQAPEGYNGLTTLQEATVVAGNDTTTVTSTVVNNAGAVLPETGGIGTTIFYALGGVLLVGSAVLFVTKKRLGE